MIPYTVIKEANRPEYSGTATGVVNFINFSFSALLGPVFGTLLTRVSDGGARELIHYQVTFEPLVWGVGLSILTAFCANRPCGPLPQGVNRASSISDPSGRKLGPLEAAERICVLATMNRHDRYYDGADPWAGFIPGLWMKEIDVRMFIQRQVTPYYGDASFLAGPTPRTLGIWDKLKALFVEERKTSVLDVSQIPSTITAHDAGYIDKDLEVIVGLQTEAPLKRAIMPNGGFRLVLTALETYGYTPDPACRRDASPNTARRIITRYSTPTPPTSALLRSSRYPDRPA